MLDLFNCPTSFKINQDAERLNKRHYKNMNLNLEKSSKINQPCKKKQIRKDLKVKIIIVKRKRNQFNSNFQKTFTIIFLK